MAQAAQTQEAQLAQLSQLVVKDRVSLGCLGDEPRRAALSLAWACLPDQPLNEPQVNAALKQALATAAKCLGTDHVELRRWLVDAGWLARDSFGRQYQRLSAEQVYPANRDWALLWQGRDVAAWVAQQREARAEQRSQRRQAWQGGQQAA